MDIQGRVAVVTGGGSGIGAALARRLHAEGARVAVADLDGASAQAVAAEIDGLPVTADVTDERDVQKLVRTVIDGAGRIDVYCSNAGIAVSGGFEVPDAGWRRSFEVHLMAHVYAARAVLPEMLRRGEGYFVGTISAAALLNHFGAAPYAVTKAAGLSFMEWLAIAYGDRGIRISAVCPQGVRTPMLERAGERNFLLAGALQPEAVAEAVVRGLHEERFLILPHPEVADFVRRKADDYDRWLAGMRRFKNRVTS